MNAPSSRAPASTLTVFCPLGLSNRLRVLLSGLALAEATGRRFTMLWPITPACAAPFADLFANGWHVQTVDASAVADLPYCSGWFSHLPDLLAVVEPHVTIGHPGWLIRLGQFPGHEPLMVRCQALFTELEPIAPIQAAVNAFRQRHFRPTMIGVHLRRGDLLRQRPDVASNTVQAIAAVDQFLAASPDAGIFLCTDDGAIAPNRGWATRREGVHETFRARYGARVVWTVPRSLDRRTPPAIQDALMDLWLLRATSRFVGTETSTFSEFAVFGRDIPQLLVAGATPGYQRLERWARSVGLYSLLTGDGRRRFGPDVPFPVILHYYATAPHRWMRRIVRSGWRQE